MMDGDGDGLASLPPPIRRLDPAVVNRIAAGEVIQRPASALKELLENSLDAHSTQIAVVVKDGGLKLLAITDNGHGIRHADLPLLCERHATSKLQQFEDLESIGTMGFRGEALASMSFVAHLSVTTMPANQAHGYRASYKDGQLEGEPRPCAAVRGTQINVEDLFYNVPARRKAFKAAGEEYARILDVISRFAVHHRQASFSCKKHGESRADVHSLPCATPVEAVRAVYGTAVARELLPLSVTQGDKESGGFSVEGCVSSANYSAKKTTLILFINDRLVECGVLKKACESAYAALLPKAAKPFLYLALRLPPQHVDVNVHPTKREVSFLEQDAVVERIQQAVEALLLESNATRTFYTQTVLPGASPADAEGLRDGDASNEGATAAADLRSTAASPSAPSSQRATQALGQGQGQGQVYQVSRASPLPEHKMVRTDAHNMAGQLHAYFTMPAKRKAEVAARLDEEQEGDQLASTRQAVRQRRTPLCETSELSSVQELLASVDRETHAGLQDIVRSCFFIGMADEFMALVQHQTCLYLLNVVTLSRELVYQQMLRRFAHCSAVRLSRGAPLEELLLLALDGQERGAAPQEGSTAELAKVLTELLQSKAEMLGEYFGMEIDSAGVLHTLPLVLDHHTPSLERLPEFMLALGNDVHRPGPFLAPSQHTRVFPLLRALPSSGDAQSVDMQPLASPFQQLVQNLPKSVFSDVTSVR
eukprot:TRINITY_DN233_c1_g1_i3.p1 TRINITY_DN233_c1_g1~~TRINITY_DN233_c1_g1_i3.p1  ORF type:complete len:709 (+),score=177.20 TRINITY_DN233_c1_g1_i3:641-2767(+)